jgi:hypothetical protein
MGKKSRDLERANQKFYARSGSIRLADRRKLVRSGRTNPTTAFLKSPANVTRVINEAEGTRLARNFASEVFVGRLR